jgi:CubicO group peptidase (beta-lactamase class C family)
MRWVLTFVSFWLATALMVAASLPTGAPEQSGMSADRLKRLSAAVRGYIDRGEVAGTVTLIARRGRIVHLEAQGLMDIASKTPMRADSIFRLASMTKPITSVAVMMLLEEGRLQLKDPVSKFLPEFKNPKVLLPNAPGTSRQGTRLVPADREITIQHLLTHTAGLAAPETSVLLHSELETFRKESSPTENLADYTKRLAKLPLHFQPGEAREYGPATNVLGRLVEVVSGQSFDRFLAERIFRPLEMNDTFFFVPDDKLPRLTTVYEPAKPNGLHAIAPAREMRGSRTLFLGAGGLSSTADDYVRFCQMLLNGGVYNGARLVSRKTVELMTTNHIGDLPLWPDLAGYRFGLGFRVLTDLGKTGYLGSAGSYGWGGAFGTYFFIDPKEEMVGIFMMQLRPYSHLNIRLDTQGLATQAIVD